ncbi:MAG: hypothetical protein HPY50_18540 [Firmicutes bacterium]|nr:hypothetical protein [Bacillota bacterium]
MKRVSAEKAAREAMDSGLNCCQAVMAAAEEVFKINLGPEAHAMGSLFREGMGSGCACGALVGLVMVSGVIARDHPHPAGAGLPALIQKRFIERFGSSCCRVIRSKRSPLEKLGNRACKKLTETTAGLMVELWEGAVGAAE